MQYCSVEKIDVVALAIATSLLPRKQTLVGESKDESAAFELNGVGR